MGKVLSVSWCSLGGSNVGSWGKITTPAQKPRGAGLHHGNAGTYWSEPEQAGVGAKALLGSPYLQGKPAGTSSQLPRNKNLWRHVLAWQKSQERRQHQGKTGYATGKKELTRWLQEDGAGPLWEEESSVFPYSMGWNRRGIICMHIPECLSIHLYKTKSSQAETAQCCHWRR